MENSGAMNTSILGGRELLMVSVNAGKNKERKESTYVGSLVIAVVLDQLLSSFQLVRQS